MDLPLRTREIVVRPTLLTYLNCRDFNSFYLFFIFLYSGFSTTSKPRLLSRRSSGMSALNSYLVE